MRPPVRSGSASSRSRINHEPSDRFGGLFLLGTIEAVAVGGEVGGGGLGGSCIRHSGTGDALINERLFQHLGADGGREASAGGGPAVGLIEADEAEELRVVDGCHGHKAGDAGFLSALSSFWLVPLLPPTR